MRHLNGPKEARLLALERFQARLADDLRALGRDGIAIGQGIWDSWGETNVPTTEGISPSPSGVLVFSATCASIPETLTVHDSV